MINLYLIDDKAESLHPFNHYLPSYLIRHGIFNLYEYLKYKICQQIKTKISIIPISFKEKIEVHFPNQTSNFNENIFVRKIIIINGKIIPNKKNWINIKKIIENEINGIHIFSLNNDIKQIEDILIDNQSNNYLQKTKYLNKTNHYNLNSINYCFEIIKNLNSLLPDHLDFYLDTQASNLYEVTKNVYSTMKNFNFNKIDFDTSYGKIIICSGAYIGAYSNITGPTWIGNNSSIKANSSINFSSIGINSKVCGEINNSIINDYSNKNHFGFIGHSIVGKWVNLGAGTTTSNLKNNYQTISVLINNEIINSEMIFLGALIGDFSKTSINTSIYPGVIFGFGSIGSGLISKNLLPFLIKYDLKEKKIKLKQFLKACEKMFSRREKKFIFNKNLIEHIFNNIIDS